MGWYSDIQLIIDNFTFTCESKINSSDSEFTVGPKYNRHVTAYNGSHENANITTTTNNIFITWKYR